MHSSGQLFIAFLLCSTALGASTPIFQTTYKRPKRDVKSVEWYMKQRDRINTKYNVQNQNPNRARSEKRQSSGSAPLININADESYSVTVSIGTPAKQYQIVLDTGSADYWMLSNACTSCTANGVTGTLYDKTGSTTFSGGTIPFGERYGSGSVNGTVATETVTLAGMTIQNQPFGVVDLYTGNIVGETASGLMGMAFSTIATIGIPFWQTASKAWSQPVFSFALSRQVTNAAAQVEEPGGIFTMGAVDNSLFTGNINYVNIPTGAEGFWLIPLDEVTMGQGTIQTGGDLSAIDTGTTLIAGPLQAIDALYSTIPNVQAGRGNQDGLYFFPCTQSITASMTFGGITYNIDSNDIGIPVGSGLCIGAFFVGNFGATTQLDKRQQQIVAPTWIIGDSFLKNVYTVFRATPPSVGFATLANPGALASNSSGLNLSGQSATVSSPGIATQGPVSVGASYTVITTAVSPKATSFKSGSTSSKVVGAWWSLLVAPVMLLWL